MQYLSKSVEQSFKAKLRALAREKNRDPADLWQNLMLERFLVRLSHSPHRSHFVLKGGILLAHYINLGRETRDLDFLARRVSNEVDKLKTTFEEIAKIDLEDGFTFHTVSVSQLIHPHMGYSGAEITMEGHFGHTRFKVSIDVGFGDIVDAIEKTVSLMSSSKGPLFEKTTQLACYPKEFIFAEKLETILHRGTFNSRMKDFHDVYSLINISHILPFHNLETIVAAVFKHRKTPLQLPIEFDDAGMNQLQDFWHAYLKGLRQKELKALPLHVAALLSELNHWLLTKIQLNR